MQIAAPRVSLVNMQPPSILLPISNLINQTPLFTYGALHVQNEEMIFYEQTGFDRPGYIYHAEATYPLSVS